MFAYSDHSRQATRAEGPRVAPGNRPVWLPGSPRAPSAAEGQGVHSPALFWDMDGGGGDGETWPPEVGAAA